MELTNLRPVLGDDGQPVMTSGNFAVVFKMQDETMGKLYALKCFTKEQQGREEAYHQIAEELKNVDSPYLVPIRYLEKELFVDTEQTDETEFPVLLMDWVEGKTLDKYLRENLDDKYALEMLAYRFSQLAQWLIPQPFAHGDLKPDNILVREDGSLVLIDYDGMYVSAMKGQKARELGSPDFRHPLRIENDFDEHIDEFSLVSILLSLNAISYYPLLLEKYGAVDRLLLSEKDYRNIILSGLIYKCACIENLPYFYPTTRKLIRCLNDLLIPDYKKEISLDLSVVSPTPLKNRVTYVLPHDRANCKMYDNIGCAKYSEDETKLLSFTDIHCGSYLGEMYEDPFFEYEIKGGTITICDYAFKDCQVLRLLTIPNTVKYIGHGAFSGCDLRYIELPLVDGICDDTFKNCPYLKHIFIPAGTYSYFEKLLPNERCRLREIDKEVVHRKIASYLQKDIDVPIYDAAEFLCKSVCNVHSIWNDLCVNFHREENNKGSVSIESVSNSGNRDWYYIDINDVTNIVDVTKVIYHLLLDTAI